LQSLKNYFATYPENVPQKKMTQAESGPRFMTTTSHEFIPLLINLL